MQSKNLIYYVCLYSFLLQTSPLPVAQGGTGNSSITINALIAGGISEISPLQTISPGTAGQILTSAGAGALPTWTKPNGMILLKALTAASSASLTFTASDFSTAFQTFVLVIDGFDAFTAGQNLFARWSTNDGSSYILTGYSSGTNTVTFNSSTVTNTNILTAINLGSASSGQHSGIYYLFGVNGVFPTGTGPCVLGISFPAFNPTLYGMTISSISGSPVVNNLQIFYGTGAIVTGKAYLYGLVY
ncbi:hypothetical protein KBB68_03085 [Candidatus Babeliales bacterium]|nr:hypothetical protein [Candidatus Babeliales bacterium]